MEFSAGQAGTDDLSLVDRAGVAEQVSVRIVDQRIAALQNPIGAQGVKAGRTAVKAARLGREATLRPLQEACPQQVETAMRVLQAKRGIGTVQVQINLAMAFAEAAQPGEQGGLGAEVKLVQALRAAVQAVLHPAEHADGAEAGEAALRAEKLEGARAEEAAMQPVEAILDTVLRGGKQLGGGGGRGGALVRGRICEGGVSGMSEAGDDGQYGGGDGADDTLIIETMEVFPAATAPGDQNDLSPVRVGIEPAKAGCDLGRAVGSLYRGGVDQQLYGGVTASANLDDVAQGRPMQAGDDADAARERRQGTLTVEEALTAETLFEALHRSQHGAKADLLHPVDNELHLAAALVDTELTPKPDGIAVIGTEAQERGLATEKHGGELSACVFEREVTMTTAGRSPVRDFTFHGDLPEATFDDAAHVADKGGDSPSLGWSGWPGFWGSGDCEDLWIGRRGRCRHRRWF